MEARPDVERRSEAGFSVIEGLIAAALLLIVTVGVLPLFSRSMLNNVKGNDSTRQSNGAIDEFERSSALPFNSGEMALAALTTSRVEDSTIALKAIPGSPNGAVSARWEPVADLAAGDQPQTIRRRTVRQFAFTDFNSTEPQNSLQNPLPEGTEDRLIHFKVIDLDIFDAARDPLATGPGVYRLRLVQAF